MRYKIEMAYNGKKYHGWQVQPNATTVQEHLNNCLSIMLKENITTLGCGRTDTGVNASYFVAHFDSVTVEEGYVADEKFINRLNKFLPPDIAIFNIKAVDDDFHARFSAKSRTYKYNIHTKKDPFLVENSMFYPFPLNIELINEGCKILMEYDDFASFCKAGGDNNTTICKLMQANFKQDCHRITFTIQADRFLRNMVRAITGTLLDLGTGRISLQQLREIINVKNRSYAGQSVPAHGLTLSMIEY